MTVSRFTARVFLILAILWGAASPEAILLGQDRSSERPLVYYYKAVEIEGLDVLYREAGPADAPAILLLHGFPTSSGTIDLV